MAAPAATREALDVEARRPPRVRAAGELLFSRGGALAPDEFLRLFRSGAGVTRETPEQLDAELLAGARLLMVERPAWEADPPWRALRRAAFPKLVISGGHSPVFEKVCDVTAERIGGRRGTVGGRGHTIPACGSPTTRCSRSSSCRPRRASIRASLGLA
ncbi:MAG: hypothetical protein ACYDC2_03545 [Solirubrobacteraceae bacterium]